jgi:hypothetical protein
VITIIQQHLHFKGMNRGKKWIKNGPKSSSSRLKSAPKDKMRNIVQEMTTVDGGGHPRVYPCAKETSVIFGD